MPVNNKVLLVSHQFLKFDLLALASLKTISSKIRPLSDTVPL